MTQRIAHVWQSIREPRHIKTVMLAYYITAIFTGVITFVSPPSLVANVVGAVMTYSFSTFLLVGGIMAAVSVYPGWWWAERIGCWFQIAGLGIVFVVAIYNAANSGSASGPILGGLIALATGVFVIRLLMIRRYSFEPRG